MLVCCVKPIAKGGKAYLHHAKMLATIVRLEQCVACPALDQYTTERPQIDGVRPTNAKDNLGRPIVPCTDH